MSCCFVVYWDWAAYVCVVIPFHVREFPLNCNKSMFLSYCFPHCNKMMFLSSHLTIFEVVCIPQTLLHLFLEASATFHVEVVPKEYGRMPVLTSHDCFVPWNEVFDIFGKSVDVLQPCYLHATGHGAPHEFVASDTHTTNWFLEWKFWSLAFWKTSSTQWIIRHVNIIETWSVLLN